MYRKVFFLIFLTLSQFLYAQNYQCKINENVFNDKEKAYLSFKKGRSLILKNQNKPYEKDFEQGLICLYQAASLDSTRALYITFLGDAYNLIGLQGITVAKFKALEFYDKALYLDKSLDATQLKAGILAVNLEFYEKSLNYFESAIENNAMHLRPNVLAWMNIAYIKLPQTSRGILFYTKIFKKYPQANILNIYKAILLKSQHNDKKAKEVIFQIIMNPKSSKKSIEMAYRLLSEIKK